MLISVVVCTYNPSEELLERVLDAIFAQDFDPTAWELLVVDNNSQSAVGALPYISRCGVRVVTESAQGLSKARECGVRNTQGAIVVFVDDDNIIAPDYLSVVSTAFSDPKVGVVSGAVTPEYVEKPPNWFPPFEGMLACRRPPTEGSYLTDSPPFDQYFAIGAGMAVRREVITGYYQAIAEGDAYISGRVGTSLSSAEDIDLDFFAISRGYLVGTIGSLKLRHVIPPSRTTIDYLSRLAESAVRSAAEVNSKWAKVFGGDVIELYSTPRRETHFKYLVSALLRWNPKFKVRYQIHKTVLALSATPEESVSTRP